MRITGWSTYLVVLLAYGFVPGFPLRAIVRLYPKDHPRRRELVAELYAVEYWKRPLFVLQQLETAISEGIPARCQGFRRAHDPTAPAPWQPDGFRGPTVCKIVGITYRQLDYWARTDLIRPSAAGPADQRAYSYRDLVELKVIKGLLDAGVSLQSARRAIEYLRAHLGNDIGVASLVVNDSGSELVRTER